jgi:glycosyltransferase involved in cell wall biosynthesis
METILTSGKVRVAYLVTHPIQYQAPLLKKIAQDSDIDLTVFFCSDVSTRQHRDPGFGREISWDVPLLEGYRCQFLGAIGNADVISTWRPFNYGLLWGLLRGGFDVLWIHGYARPYHWYAIAAARLLGIKVLIRDEATDFSSARGPVRRFLKRVFFLVLARCCNGFLAIGTSNREYYLKNGIPGARVFDMPYAVDNAYFAARARKASKKREQLRAALALEPGRKVILFASKLMARKRPDQLLEAYIRLLDGGNNSPVPYLLFVGDGDLRLSLERRVAEMKLDTVRILGFANQSELPAFFDLCDVFVLPSVFEPWGLVVNEAMNAGKAIIVSDHVGCAADLVCHLENGYIYGHDSLDDLQMALVTITAEPRIASEMGKRSFEIVSGWGFEADVAGLKTALRAVI